MADATDLKSYVSTMPVLLSLREASRIGQEMLISGNIIVQICPNFLV